MDGFGEVKGQSTLRVMCVCVISISIDILIYSILPSFIMFYLRLLTT